MIRRSFVVLVALVFTLACGIAVGAGPLSSAESPAPEAAPRTEAEPSPPDPRAAYADSLAAATASRLVAGDELAGRGVSVVRLPGVPDEQLGALLGQVGATGATVASVYAVQPALLDLSQRSLVDTLGSQLAEQLAELTVPDDATAYDRIGALLGGVLAAKMRKGAELSGDAGTIDQSLASAGLVLAETAATQRSPLVLVVLGDQSAGDEGAGDQAGDQVLAGLVRGLAGAARAVVVAGNAASAVEDGALARLRAGDLAPGVTTVDGVDGPAGQITTALALIRSFTEPGGAFGASGSDGPVPMG